MILENNLNDVLNKKSLDENHKRLHLSPKSYASTKSLNSVKSELIETNINIINKEIADLNSRIYNNGLESKLDKFNKYLDDRFNDKIKENNN